MSFDAKKPSSDVADERRDYIESSLDRHQLTREPMVQFERWLDEARQNTAIIDATAMVLGTCDTNNRPFQRVVLLKGVDSGLVFYTNYKSRKGEQLASNTEASLLFPWLAMDRQVIVNGRAEILAVDQVEEYFARRPRASRLSAWASEQSQPIDSRAILEAKLTQVEQRFADKEVPLPTNWGGYRIIPWQFEFWQGREGRLHDRFIYTKTEQNWNIERLQP